jgi:hypothetical protein
MEGEEGMRNQEYMVNQEVKLLLVNQSSEKVEVLYNSNPTPYKMPKIGPRPPYYYHPRNEPYYPKI